MLSRRTTMAFAVLGGGCLVGSVSGTPLRMDYEITDLGGGLFDYEFTLVVDNNDGSYQNGQTWRWFVFGDSPVAPTPLANFVGDVNDLPIGPYTGYGQTSGGHNGPDLQSVVDDWVPTGVGDSLFWSGTSTAFLGQGDMLWSNVIGGSANPGVRGNFEVAHLVPAPGGAALLGLGGLLMTRRRR